MSEPEKRMRVEEITVGEAFQRCRPPEYRHEPSREKLVFCADCEKMTNKIIAINDQIGVSPCCGCRIFDWRGLKKIGTPLDNLTEAFRQVIKTYGVKVQNDE